MFELTSAVFHHTSHIRWRSLQPDVRFHTGGARSVLILVFLLFSWTHVRWLDPHSSTMRIIGVSIIVFVWLVSGDILTALSVANKLAWHSQRFAQNKVVSQLTYLSLFG